MNEFPDVYADGYAISVGKYGVTLTLRRSNPPSYIEGSGRQSGKSVTSAASDDVVVRVRMTPALAQAIASGVQQALKQSSAVRGDKEQSKPN